MFLREVYASTREEELDLTGAQAALPIWTTFMMDAEVDRPVTDFPAPPGLSVWKPAPVHHEEEEAEAPGDTEGPAEAPHEDASAPAPDEDAAAPPPAEDAAKPPPESDPND